MIYVLKFVNPINWKPFLIAAWYRLPCSSLDLFLYYKSFLNKVDSLGLEYYLLGDLNCNLATFQYDSNTRRLCEISDLFELQQLITEPTRITETSWTLIALVFTNYADRVVCSGVSQIGISDHSLIYVYRKLSLAFPSKGHSAISYGNFKNFKNFNRESFRTDITRQDWAFNGSDDPNVLWADWKTKFLDVVNFHAPLRTKRTRIKKAPWINSELKKGMRHRDAAKREAMESNDPRDWPKVKLWNTINNNIKTSKASYYCNAFSQSKGNSRKTRQTIKELTSRRTNNKPEKELKLNGSIISNSSELLMLLMTIFQQLSAALPMKFFQIIIIMIEGVLIQFFRGHTDIFQSP